MENNLDRLFKRKLENQEPEFTPAAWERMDQLLDEEGFVPKKKKPRRAVFIIIPIFLLGLLTFVVGYSIISEDSQGDGSTLNPTAAVSNQKTLKSNVIHSEASYESKDQVSTSRDEAGISEADILRENYTSSTSLVNQSKIEFSNERNQNESTIQDEFGAEKSSTRIDKVSRVFAGETATESKTVKPNSDLEPNKNISLRNTSNSFVTFADERAVTPDKATVEEGVSSMPENKWIENSLPNRVAENISILPGVEMLTVQQRPFSQTIPKLYFQKVGVFEAGIQLNSRYNAGLGYAIGAFGSVYISAGLQLGVSAQYDAQSFDIGPSISVFDKQYSFGSTTTERTFELNRKKSLRVGLNLRKQFDAFALVGGAVVYKTLQTDGSILSGNDVELAVGRSVENESIRPLTYGIELGAAFALSRFIDLNAGIEVRTGAFTSSENVTNSKTYLYPTLGLRYKLIKL